MNDRLKQQFKSIIKNDSWQKPTVKQLAQTDLWASQLAASFLDPHQLGWSISADRADGNSSVIKIDDGYLRYMLVIPQGCYDESICDQWYWMIGDDPNNVDHSIHPDQASAYLLKRTCPGIKVIDVRQKDGPSLTTLQTPDGRKLTVHWPAAFFDDKTYTKP